MFWGLSMEPQKRYTQVVSESFHISQAAVDVSSVVQENSPTQVILEFESNDFLLATLSKNAKIFQVPLDLNFMKGDHVSFRTVGPGIVHLSGYHVFDDDDDLESRLLEAEDSDDEEIDESMETSGGEDSISAPPGKRKKTQVAAGKSKKSKLESESEDDDDDEDDTINSSALGGLEGEEDSDEDDEEEEGDDDDDEEENGDLDEEEEDDSDSAEEDSDEEEEEVKVNTKKGKQVNGTASPATNKVNKNLLNNSKKDVKTPKSEAKSDKKSLNQSKQEKTPKLDKTPKQEKTPKGANANTPSAGSPKQKKVLEGGVIAEDLKVGEGPVAKPGKMAQVYYVGRLKSNNKQFDATSGGPGFKFRLGRGEVIRGWDVGVAGMKVGGKRRLTVPAGLAYGAKGQPPTIPPNATLVFDVELRGIS